MYAKKHVFSHTERKVFFNILKKYNNIIESKKTDGTSLRRKNEAWICVTGEYNASPLATRQATTKQLRHLWINTKQRQREALTIEHQRRLSTGGSDADLDPDVSMVVPAIIMGIDNAIDSDAVEDSVKPRIPAPVEVEEVMLPSASQTSAINEEETVALDPYLQPESPKPSTSQISQPFPIITNKSHPHSASIQNLQPLKNEVIEQVYKNQSVRVTETHNLEMLILKEQLREAKAKADLAELILKQNQESSGQ